MADIIQLYFFICLGIILFSIGLLGIFVHTSAIRILISIEIMLNAAILNFAAFNSYLSISDFSGWSFAFIIFALAAAEAVIGLAIFLSVYRRFQDINLGNIFFLGEATEKN